MWMMHCKFISIHTVPVIPNIPEVFPTTDGILVYPSIGCLTDDITNYNITVSYSLCCVYCTPYALMSMFFQVIYHYTPCFDNVHTDSMILPAADGSLFNITGLGSYTK